MSHCIFRWNVHHSVIYGMYLFENYAWEISNIFQGPIK